MLIIEGFNILKKHTKPNTSKLINGGILNKELPVHISNVCIYNKYLKKIKKVSFKKMKNQNIKHRCFKCNGKIIDF